MRDGGRGWEEGWVAARSREIKCVQRKQVSGTIRPSLREHRQAYAQISQPDQGASGRRCKLRVTITLTRHLKKDRLNGILSKSRTFKGTCMLGKCRKGMKLKPVLPALLYLEMLYIANKNNEK